MRKLKRRHVSRAFLILQADEVLTRDELRSLITAAVTAGVFKEFFAQKEHRIDEAVEALFNEIFLDEFADSENDMISHKQFDQAVAA
jgi:glutathionyl-hydroquinone reductase